MFILWGHAINTSKYVRVFTLLWQVGGTIEPMVAEYPRGVVTQQLTEETTQIRWVAQLE